MASEERARAGASATKVIGLGAPTSVWIYFEIAEIPALIDAIGDEFARHGGSAQIDGRTLEPEARCRSHRLALPRRRAASAWSVTSSRRPRRACMAASRSSGRRSWLTASCAARSTAPSAGPPRRPLATRPRRETRSQRRGGPSATSRRSKARPRRRVAVSATEGYFVTRTMRRARADTCANSTLSTSPRWPADGRARHDCPVAVRPLDGERFARSPSGSATPSGRTGVFA
jgi:hypothetical protein